MNKFLTTLCKPEWYIPIVVGVGIGLYATIFFHFQEKEPSKSATVIEEKVPVSAEEKKVNDDKMVGLMLDDLLREFRATDVCYDSKLPALLVNIGKHTHTDDTWDQGWQLIEKYEFLELQNGTYILKSNSNLIQIAPDTTGLACKHKPPNNTWFQ